MQKEFLSPEIKIKRFSRTIKADMLSSITNEEYLLNDLNKRDNVVKVSTVQIKWDE